MAEHLKELAILLESHYGHSAFRPLQLEAMSETLSGGDCLLVLPTGGGKSVTFQLPAVLRRQVTLVVSPLLALAKDQVDNANDADIEAASWSSQTSETQKAALARDLVVEDGSLRLLYTTPESLQTERLLEAITTAHAAGRLCSLAIDESHACCQWGHDFRPSYLTLGDLRSKLPGLPVIAVTATATERVRRSIIDILQLERPQVLLASFNRPEIQYNVQFKELLGDGSKDAVVTEAARFIMARPGESGIVYCRLRATCDEVAAALRAADIEAAAYHAGMDPARRSRVQQDWKEDALQVVVATVAFGMGLDKADVRFVLHVDPPATLEGLSQEAGRAGRDGLPATSVVFSSNEDLKVAQRMEKSGGATAALAEYIQTAGCRRKALLVHFGEKRSGGCSAAEGEQLCDYCGGPRAAAAKVGEMEAKLEAAAAAGGDVSERSGDGAAPSSLQKAASCTPSTLTPAAKRKLPRPVLMTGLQMDRGLKNSAADEKPSIAPTTAPTSTANGVVPKKRRPAFQPPRPIK